MTHFTPLRESLIRSAILVGVLALPACSADALAEPEPTLEQPGAFFAAEDGARLSLFRTLSPWVTEAGSFLFVSVYDVAPTSWEEAREMSKNHDIPLLTVSTLLRRDSVEATTHRVVWFRSLTREEEDRVP
jgi:hypothetical protein